MKKYILATLILFIPCVTYALTMCARDTSLVVSLNPKIAGDNTQINKDDFTWSVNFEYGTILGEATCLSDAEGGKPSGYRGVITNSNGEMIPNTVPKGLSGASDPNPENPELSTGRGHCWCRMTHPAISRWVFVLSRFTTSDCTVSCSDYCASNIKSIDVMRSGMFGSIGL